MGRKIGKKAGKLMRRWRLYTMDSPYAKNRLTKKQRKAIKAWQATQIIKR